MMSFGGALLLLVFGRPRLTRRGGLLLMLAYLAYVGWRSS